VATRRETLPNSRDNVGLDLLSPVSALYYEPQKCIRHPKRRHDAQHGLGVALA
jgi:hypothetical protein